MMTHELTDSQQTASSTPAIDKWKAWDDFVASTPDAGFMQTSSWADFRLALGYEHFGAVVKSRGRILGGAIVQKCWHSPESCFYYIQDGPVLPRDGVNAREIFEVTLQEIDDHRQNEQAAVSHLRIEPRWQALPDFVTGFQGLLLQDSFVEPRRTLCVDLQPPEAAILAQMKPKGRYNIRLAQKHGVSVSEDSSVESLAEFQSIYENMAERQRIDSKSPEYFETLIAILAEQKSASIFFAEHEGLRLAGALVVYCGKRATYFFGGSLETRRNVMAPYLLHFEIMRKAKASGYEEYDFWGISPENEPDDPWHNISVFKRKFGGREISLVPTLDYVYDRAAYDDFVASERCAYSGREEEEPVLQVER